MLNGEKEKKMFRKRCEEEEDGRRTGGGGRGLKEVKEQRKMKAHGCVCA